MTDVTYSHLGSGTSPYITGIRNGQILSDGSIAEGYRRGINVNVINPEDYNSSPIFRTSGVIIAGDAVAELPTIYNLYNDDGVHRRTVEVTNLGPAPYVLIYHDINVIDEFGWPLGSRQSKKFDLLDNVQLFAKASGVVADVRWYEY